MEEPGEGVLELNLALLQLLHSSGGGELSTGAITHTPTGSLQAQSSIWREKYFTETTVGIITHALLVTYIASIQMHADENSKYTGFLAVAL